MKLRIDKLALRNMKSSIIASRNYRNDYINRLKRERSSSRKRSSVVKIRRSEPITSKIAIKRRLVKATLVSVNKKTKAEGTCLNFEKSQIKS